MKHRNRIVVIGFLSAFGALGACLDMSPTVVDQSQQSTVGPPPECRACITGADGIEPNCAAELQACSMFTACWNTYLCSIDGHCKYGRREDFIPCAAPCATRGGILSGDNPATKPALALYNCEVLGPCASKCFPDSVPAMGGDAGNDASAGPDASSDSGSGEGGAGACTNDGDRATIAAGLADQSRECATNCIGGEPSCAASCMETKTGMSHACSICWGDRINCGLMNCLGVCLDPSSQACADCNAQNCVPAYHTCSGL